MLSALQVPTKAALLRSPRLFALLAEGGRTALAAVRTTENACTVDRRKLVCTDGRYAERQRIIVAEANRLAEPMAASAAMPPRRGSHSPGAALLRAASCQWNFLWVGQREGYLFFKKRYPSLVSPLLWHIFPPSRPYYGRKSKREGGYGAVIGKLRGKCARAG